MSDSISVSSSSADNRRRFHGSEALYGAAAMRQLAAARFCVIGIGGVGSWAAEALARSGVGGITLVDMDHVAESNINRQIHALESTLGAAKTAVMRTRILDINPACRVDVVEDWVSAENVRALLGGGFDMVIDCIDDFRTKAAVVGWCRSNKQRMITIGGAGGRRDPTCIRVADLIRSENDALLSRTRRLLREDYGFPRNLRRRFHIPCIYSVEPARQAELAVAGQQAVGALSCAGGLGSSVMVTAAMGLTAAAQAVERHLQRMARPTPTAAG
jgi:tRNA A37 threonylcarbamoyladenosine dehydratase